MGPGSGVGLGAGAARTLEPLGPTVALAQLSSGATALCDAQHVERLRAAEAAMLAQECVE